MIDDHSWIKLVFLKDFIKPDNRFKFLKLSKSIFIKWYMDMVRDHYIATLFLTLWKENRYHKWENSVDEI